MKMFIQLLILTALLTTSCVKKQDWVIDSQQQWELNKGSMSNLEFKDGMVFPNNKQAYFKSIIKKFDSKRSVEAIVFEQSSCWLNWEPAGEVGPSNLGDAPVFLCIGKNNYWMFGRYNEFGNSEGFKPEIITVEGFDMKLQTTPDSNQFNAPGGLKKDLGGYHAWHSRDMINWVHHGNITEKFSRWVTTAEYVDGKFYIYYDYPNDENPHLYIDDDLADGKPGKDMGMAFMDPSHGSDCGVIRDLQGMFHLYYEDWTPIDASKHSWDSPLAGHAISKDGISNFKILNPAVDERTQATGEKAIYYHPHWKQHPDWDDNIGEYEIHKPEQNAFGDWAPISVGGQYYLFGDWHPVEGEMGIVCFTSDSPDGPFERCGKIGKGHPDPDIGFAEGKFYLLHQRGDDFVSSGPWVKGLSSRIGVDTDNDGSMDVWTDWIEVKETYDYIEGFAKQIKKVPAASDIRNLPQGYGFQIEFKIDADSHLPALDKITMTFQPG